MSTSFSAHSITAALLSADKILDETLVWEARNDNQRQFLSCYYQLCREDVPKVPEITGQASFSIETINKEAKKADARQKLDESESENPLIAPLGVFGKLDVLVKWIKAGYPEAIERIRERDKFEFPAVKMKNGGLRFCISLEHPYPIACLATESDYSVYLTEATEPFAGLELMGMVTKLHDVLSFSNQNYSGIVFPMVDLRDNPDISWFEEMSAPNKTHPTLPTRDNIVSIKEAKQENILRMDEIGARVISMTSIKMGILGARAEYIPPPLIIDEPFFFWLMRPDCHLPLFAAYVTEEHWKKPKSLSNLEE